MTKWEATRLLNLRAKRDIGFRLTSVETLLLTRLEGIEHQQITAAEEVMVEAKRLMAQSARLIKQAKKLNYTYRDRKRR